MARRRHTPEQIIRKLREADRMLAEGSELADVARHLEVSEQTYHRWRNQDDDSPPWASPNGSPTTTRCRWPAGSPVVCCSVAARPWRASSG